MYFISYFSEAFPIFGRRPPSWVRNHPPPFINHIESKRIMVSTWDFLPIPEVIHHNILQGFEENISCLHLMKVLLTYSNSSVSYGSYLYLVSMIMELLRNYFSTLQEFFFRNCPAKGIIGIPSSWWDAS